VTRYGTVGEKKTHVLAQALAERAPMRDRGENNFGEHDDWERGEEGGIVVGPGLRPEV